MGLCTRLRMDLECGKCSVVSDSLQPHELHSPWNAPGKNTGVGSLSLLQGLFPTQGSNPNLLHCRWILYQLSYQGKLCKEPTFIPKRTNIYSFCLSSFPVLLSFSFFSLSLSCIKCVLSILLSTEIQRKVLAYFTRSPLSPEKADAQPGISGTIARHESKEYCP